MTHVPPLVGVAPVASMIGAIATHIRAGDTLLSYVAAIVGLVLAVAMTRGARMRPR